MSDSDRQIATRIDRLITMCGDRASALQAAADAMEDADFACRLRARAERWAHLGDELRSAVCRPRGEARNGGSVFGALHRTWIYIKAAVNEGEAIRLECRRREAAAVRLLREALRQGLPDHVRLIVKAFVHQAEGADSRPQQRRRTDVRTL